MPEIELTSEQKNALSIFETEDNQPPRWQKRLACRQYYDGIHSTQLTERQRQYLQITTGIEFNDNYCPVVVDALAERLVMTGFTVSASSESTAQSVEEILSSWLKLSNFDELQGDVYNAAICDADAYILIEWDNETARPRITFEPAATGSSGVEMFYDRQRRPRFASKLWTEDGITRLNLYYPDRIEKYEKSDSGWAPHLEDGIPWPEPWLAGMIPVVHFRNRARGYNYGKSELSDVIPLQNALNKAIIDLVAAADTTAFRIYWMTGDDPSGIAIVPGTWVYSEDPETNVGHIPGEDLTKLVDFKDAFAVEIARVSRTPLSLFQLSGQVAAEGTLKQQESGLVSRAESRQTSFGNSWERTAQIMIRLWNTYGPDPSIDENIQIESQWKDAETRNGLDYLSELEKKRGLGVPYETIWAEMGYTASQISDMLKSEEYLLLRLRSLYETANSGGVDPGTLARQLGWSDEDIAMLYGNETIEEETETDVE